MAFNALINAFRPDLLNFSDLKAANKLDNLNQVPTPTPRPRATLCFASAGVALWSTLIPSRPRASTPRRRTRALLSKPPAANLLQTLTTQAFDTAEANLGIAKILDAEDMVTMRPDEKSVMTYAASPSPLSLGTTLTGSTSP